MKVLDYRRDGDVLYCFVPARQRNKHHSPAYWDLELGINVSRIAEEDMTAFRSRLSALHELLWSVLPNDTETERRYEAFLSAAPYDISIDSGLTCLIARANRLQSWAQDMDSAIEDGFEAMQTAVTTDPNSMALGLELSKHGIRTLFVRLGFAYRTYDMQRSIKQTLHLFGSSDEVLAL